MQAVIFLCVYHRIVVRSRYLFAILRALGLYMCLSSHLDFFLFLRIVRQNLYFFRISCSILLRFSSNFDSVIFFTFFFILNKIKDVQATFACFFIQKLCCFFITRRRSKKSVRCVRRHCIAFLINY